MTTESRLIAEAIVTYADSCTLPLLTEGCPFYRIEDGGPTCGEECREIAARLGVEGREERTVDVHGLRMHGRALPVSAAGGMADWDATREYLRDNEKAPREQSTSSLLRSLALAVSGNALRGDESRLQTALELWGEANRRIGALDQIFATGIAEQAAGAVIARVVLERLHREGRMDTAHILPTGNGSSSGWLEAAEMSAGRVGAHPTRRSFLDAPDPRVLMQILPQLFETGQQVDDVLSDPVLAHVLSGVFRRRVTGWLANLLEHDLEATLSVRPPNPALFAAQTPVAPSDTTGRWLWERFTVTRLEEWAISSLTMEWDWVVNGSSVSCDKRAMAERTFAAEILSSMAMNRSLRRAQQAHRKPGFDPNHYTHRASELLVQGEYGLAIAIFKALVDLSPGSADAWNNLGFCQLGDEPHDALSSLLRAEALSRTPSLITAANLTLAHHLLGQDEEALALGRGALERSTPPPNVRVWLWEHPVADEDADLEASIMLERFDDVRVYLEGLVDHITATEFGRCGSIS